MHTALAGRVARGARSRALVLEQELADVATVAAGNSAIGQIAHAVRSIGLGEHIVVLAGAAGGGAGCRDRVARSGLASGAAGLARCRSSSQADGCTMNSDGNEILRF